MKTLLFKGTVSPHQNRLKMVWLLRPWLGHLLLHVRFENFYCTFEFFTVVQSF